LWREGRGEEKSSVSPDGKLKYATYTRDSTLAGQDYADQRYYSMNMGRFFSPDPSGVSTADPKDPQSWNRYGYVQGDPVNHKDNQKIRAILGARHDDAPGPGEDKWALSLYARKDGADANIGFYRWADDSYHSVVTLRDGAGRKWEALAGGPLKPMPLEKK
jgi:RHS repeat-associated protein